MRRLYPLRQGATFDEVSQLMEDAGFELTRLEGCAFPSRPEAKLATWSNDGVPVARYRYEPDIELRWMAIDRREDRASFAAELVRSELFDEWCCLKKELVSGAWNAVFRAAAAFRVAAEVRESEVDGEGILAAALSSDEAWTRRAAATQLAQVATPSSRAAIEDAVRDCEDIETKIALRRSIERIDMAEFSSR